MCNYIGGRDLRTSSIGPSGRDDDLSSNHKKRYSEGTIGGVGCEGGKGGDSGVGDSKTSKAKISRIVVLSTIAQSVVKPIGIMLTSL